MTQVGKDDGQIPARESGDKDKFPEGMRVLAVDDNTVCLRLLEAFLLQCRYKVTVTTEAVNALKLLRENKNFDIVITDVHMLDMDGFRLLEIIGLEMDLPVIMMSSNDDQRTVMKGIKHGACNYLLKPIRLEEIKNIWQHVIRRSKLDTDDLNAAKGAKYLIPKSNKRHQNHSKENEEQTNLCSDDHSSAQKRPRVAWSLDLHTKFIIAFNKLGPDKAVPSKILKQMNVPGLTREKIASHLQKYRNALRKNRSQESNIIMASDGMDEHLQNNTILSFEEQGHSGINCSDGFGKNIYCGSGMTQFSNRIQNPNNLSICHANPASFSLPLNQQDILPQQYPQVLEVVDQTCQRIKVSGLGGIFSNSISMDNIRHQPYLNEPKYQPFSSRTRLYNKYLEFSSSTPCYNASSEPNSSASTLLEYASHSHPTGAPIDLVGSQCQMPNDAISTKLRSNVQNDPVFREVQNLLPGQYVGKNLAHSDIRSSNGEHSIGMGSKIHLETESIFHLSSCTSTDDDLNAAINQFH